MINKEQESLPKGWKEAPLGEVVSILDSLRVPLNAKERANRKGQYPYFGANGQVDTINEYIFDGEYVLLAEDGGFFDQPGRGVAYKVNGKFWVNNHAHVLGALAGMPISFLLHFLNSINWMPHVSGTTRLKLNQGNLRKVAFYVPPLQEQHRIAQKIELLQSKSKKARQALETARPLLDKLRQSVLASAFRGDLTADWRAKNPDTEPASVLLERIRKERRKKWEQAELAKMKTKGKEPENDKWKERYKEPEPVDTSGLPELPGGWCWIRLSECGEMARGKSKHRPRNAPPLFGDKYPFVQTGEVAQANGRITIAKKFYSDTGLAQSRLFPIDTVCITIAANIADSAVLGIEACFPDSIVGIIVDKNLISPTYLETYIRTIRGELSDFAPATAQKNINLTILREVAVPVPPINELYEIDKKIQKAMFLSDLIEQKIIKANYSIDKLDQSILAKAFRGELVLQNPDDEPASELLKRIKAEREAQKKKPKKRGKK